MKQKSLIKNSFFNILYTISNLVFPLLTSMYVSRKLLPSGVGQVAYAQNITSYFLTIAALGIPTYGVREVAKVREDREKLNSLFTELVLINAISTLLTSFFYFLLILNVVSIYRNLKLYMATGLALFFNFINIDWFYKGEEEYVYIACRSILIKMISFIALLCLVKEPTDMVIYALISTLAVGGNYFFNIIHARQFVTLSFKNLNLVRHINSILIFAFSFFMSSLYSKIDITMLGIMSTDEAVGLYSYAHKTISLAISVGTAISTVFLPRLSLYFKNNILLFHRLLQEGIRILAFILFPLAVGLFVFSTEVVFVLFGEKFISCACIIQIFIPLILISGFGNLLCYQMVLCSGSEKNLLIAYSMGAISNIVFNMILIPLIGGRGAAIASVISELILNTYELIKMKNKIGFRIDTKILGQGIISSLIMGVILALFKRSVDINIILKLMIGVFIGIFVYIISNFALKNKLLFDIKEKISEKL